MPRALGIRIGVPGAAEEAPSYTSGLAYDLEWTQNTAITSINLATCFSGSTASYSVVEGALPSGVTLSSGIISGTPTGFRGRNWITIHAENGAGEDDRRFLLSVKPDEVSGAFGTPYATIYDPTTLGVSTISAQTVADLNDVLIRDMTITGQLQLRGVNNACITRCAISHSADADGLRLSQTGSGCDQIVAYGNSINSSGRDSIGISGDWPFHGPDLHILNNYIYNSGNNASPKEHGMYIMTMCYIHGNIVYNSGYGNAISTRSSADIRCNFVYTANDAGVSYYCDHPESDPNSWICRGNVVVNAGQDGISYDFLLRDVPDANNRVSTFEIVGNWGTADEGLYEAQTGYSGASITASGNTTLASDAAGLAMFPATPWV